MARKDISDIQVLRAYKQAERNWKANDGRRWWPEEILVVETGQPVKVCLAAMERAFDRGLIDYGVSLRSGYITLAGKALLEGASPAVPARRVTFPSFGIGDPTK